MKNYKSPVAECVMFHSNDIVTVSVIEDVGTVVFYGSGEKVAPGFGEK